MRKKGQCKACFSHYIRRILNCAAQKRDFACAVNYIKKFFCELCIKIFIAGNTQIT